MIMTFRPPFRSGSLHEVWHGQAHKLSYLKVWGCEALVKRDTLTKPDKLEHQNKVLVAQNAEFLENSLINQEASGSLEDLEIIQEEDTHPVTPPDGAWTEHVSGGVT
ncbi:hypothetical protein Tco_0420154 [Tanacetum coccineum]